MKLLHNFWRQLNFVKGLVMKIEYPPAFDTFEVLVRFHIAVKPLNIAQTLNGKGGTDFVQSQQRAIDSVQRYVRKDFTHPAKNHFRRWVLIGLDQRIVNSHSLGGNPKAGGAAFVPKDGQKFFRLAYIRVVVVLWHR